MPRTLTLLLCSPGPRVPLLNFFRAAGRVLNVRVRVVATDERPELSAACQVADASHRVSAASDSDFVPQLLEICRREKVRLVVPCLDADLLPLADARATFEKAGIEVAISSPSVVRLARDKLETARRLHAAGIDVPDTVPLAEFMAQPERLMWPVIAKPIGGTSSVGIIRPRRAGDLHRIPDDTYLVQEMLRGPEYTVNLFFDRKGRMHCAVPHRRLEVRSGVVSKATTERVPVLQEAAAKLATVLEGARGALCFQAIVTDSGKAKVFELNARFGGGYPIAHRAGAHFTRWILEELMGRPLTARDRWRAGLTMLCYDSAVFVAR